MAEWREEPPGSGRWRKQIWNLGRPIKLTFRGSKADAQQYEARRRIELGAIDPATSESVFDFEHYCAERYRPHAQATLRPSTWSVRKFQLENLLLHFGRVKLPKLREPEIEAYKMKRLADGADKVTVNTELNVLSATLTYARETLKLPCASPKIRRFKITKNKGRIEFYSRREVDRILSVAMKETRWFYPMLVFLFETGCRKSEAINLPWKHVSFDQRIVRIWNDTDDAYEVKSVEREVPISDHLLVVLKKQKLAGLSKEWVFPCHTDRMGTKGAKLYEFPDNTWTRIVGLAGLKGGPHKARHTFASHFLAVKPDLFLLGRLLGHSHTRVTELYAHLIPEHLAEARNVVSFGSVAAKTAPGASRRKTHPGPTLAASKKHRKPL
jgi:integrase